MEPRDVFCVALYVAVEFRLLCFSVGANFLVAVLRIVLESTVFGAVVVVAFDLTAGAATMDTRTLLGCA